MSLLTVCQAVAQDAGFDSPASIVGNPDESAIQLLALANKAGEIIARKPWQNLQNEYTFSTVDGTETYALPAGYRSFINDTAWDRTNYWTLRGSLSPQEWQARKSGVMAQSPRSRFRLKGNLIYIDPVPGSALDLVIEYLDNRWVQSEEGERFTAFQADTDTVRFDEFLLRLDLTWRFLARKGLAYAEEKEEAERQIDLAMGRDTPSVPTNLAGDRSIWPPLPTVPVTGYGS
jgi:hypothetical protein